MYLVNILCEVALTCCIMISLVTSDAVSEQFTISANDTVTTLVRTEGSITQIEPDLFAKGRLLFIDALKRLRTTDGQTITTTVVGSSSSDCGYRDRGCLSEGVGVVFAKLTSFVQLTSSKVIVIDSNLNCLRLVDRNSLKISYYVGHCETYPGGYYDGSGTNARFKKPLYVIIDQVKQNNLIVADSGNNALRTVDSQTKQVGTLVKLDKLKSPSSMTQDVLTGDIFVSGSNVIWRFEYANQKLVYLTGKYSDGFQDGPFDTAKFDAIFGMLKIADDKLLIADQGNKRLRLLDLNTTFVSSICTGNDETLNGNLKICRLTMPASLVVINKTLYIGTNGWIRQLQGKSVHNPAIGVSNPDDRGFCINKNVTKILPPGKDTIDVEIVPGIAVEIGAGEFTFKMNKFAFKCNHHVKVVKDAGVLRRLSFTAEYDVKCDLTSGEIAQSTLASMALSNVHQLKQICGNDCGTDVADKPIISCADDNLKIVWPTDVSYTADVSKVAVELERKLASRQTGSPILSVFILNHQPPVVFPKKSVAGRYVEASLVSICRDKKKSYDAVDDTCK